MRRRILCYNQSENGGPVEPSIAKVCDVVFANKNNGELVIVHGDESSWKSYSSSTWEPIGIVVIPGEHGVLKDENGRNQCGVMSLVPMNYNTPEQGSISEQYTTGEHIYWGGYGRDISGKTDGLGRYDSYNDNGLQNYHQVVVVEKSNPTVPIRVSGSTYMPSQTSIGGTPQWYNSDSAYGAPSPYAGNDYKSGDLNPAYTAVKSFSSSANCLSDFRGIVNTKIITDLAAATYDWKTVSTITNSGSTNHYPATCCCARFKPIGTKAFHECTTEELKKGKGFWYFPAMGELGYIIPRFADINQTIRALKSAYGVGRPLDTNPIYSSRYWSSTEYNGNFARGVGLSSSEYGFMCWDTKSNMYNVRAFMRL